MQILRAERSKKNVKQVSQKLLCILDLLAQANLIIVGMMNSIESPAISTLFKQRTKYTSMDTTENSVYGSTNSGEAYCPSEYSSKLQISGDVELRSREAALRFSPERFSLAPLNGQEPGRREVLNTSQTLNSYSEDLQRYSILRSQKTENLRNPSFWIPKEYDTPIISTNTECGSNRNGCRRHQIRAS